MLHGIDKIASLKKCLSWFLGIYLKVLKINFVTDHMGVILNKGLDFVLFSWNSFK